MQIRHSELFYPPLNEKKDIKKNDIKVSYTGLLCTRFLRQCAGRCKMSVENSTPNHFCAGGATLDRLFIAGMTIG